jgi:hypothetical protein
MGVVSAAAYRQTWDFQQEAADKDPEGGNHENEFLGMDSSKDSGTESTTNPGTSILLVSLLHVLGIYQIRKIPVANRYRGSIR